MIPLKKALTSSIGKKYLMALSGLALVIFVITHLLGNLTLLFPDGALFNAYAEKLKSLGNILIVMELGLVATALLHVFVALSVTKSNLSGRGSSYVMSKSKGGASHSSFASRNMIVTGLILLGFLILHLWQFKFGPGVAEGYVSTVDGHEVRDLYRLVREIFSNPVFVAIYVGVMVFLGMHLRHGFWSAFQSLGIAYPRVTKQIHFLGLVLALILAIGFLVLPLFLFFKN